MTTAVATYVDERSGAREAVSYFGDGPSKLMLFVHSPSGEPAGSLVVCSPIAEEFQRNYRREVLLGRALAGEGIVVLRFHYRGSGGSDGEAEDLTFETMVEDALAATDIVGRDADAGRLAFLGTRLGGMVAARAAARHAGAPLALWEPAVDGTRYMHEVLRGRVVYALRNDATEDDRPADDLAELRREGVVDVLGHPISLRLFDSVVGLRLPEEAAATSRPLFLAQIGPHERLRPEYVRLADRWRTDGWDVEAQSFLHPRDLWWFAGPDDTVQPGVRMRASAALLAATKHWLLAHIAVGAST